VAVLDAFDLTGKTAVVTGGNTGLGQAFATALTEAGASVALAARTRERSEAVAKELSDSGAEAIAVDLDVTDRAQVGRMLDEVTERLGPVDVLVNNAGVCYHRPAAEIPVESG
jgi:NAD(P)-dependent dehydrogenase (short-subunit alcohol dehydrogenase family)